MLQIGAALFLGGIVGAFVFHAAALLWASVAGAVVFLFGAGLLVELFMSR